MSKWIAYGNVRRVSAARSQIGTTASRFRSPKTGTRTARGGEAVFQIIAVANRSGELRQSQFDLPLQVRPAELRPHLMTTVLRIFRHTGLVAAEPRLKDYQARCEARPAFQRALRDQMAAFEKR